MKRRFSYVTVEEAFKIITNATNICSLDSETIPIKEAYSRVLAEKIVSKVNVPPQDISHFDGFAIKAVDTNEASVRNPVYFKVSGKIYPGQKTEYGVNHGEACYITTGSILPKGTDSVVAIEATKMVDKDKIEVRAKVDPYEHVIRCGSDIKSGQIVLNKGHIVRAQDIGMLATIRIGKIKVVKKTRVAIICVGDELTDRIEKIEPEKVVNSHSYAISAMIAEAGGVPVYLGIVPDNMAKIKEKLEEGLFRADMVLLVGGSSMGKKDVTPDAINSVGQPGMIIHGIKRKPGRVSGFALVRSKPVVSLPGLCHSMVVGFHAFVFPMILVMSGLSLADSQLTLRAKITKPISFKSFIAFEQVTFVNVKRTKEGYLADPYLGESASFSVLGKANAFIVSPPNKTTVNTGEEMDVSLLPGFFSLKEIFTTIP